ncbi:exonuclease 1-like isoform X2 [Pomacea canaliculata]|uniref:exonuclease 1-like isoform X2 n=1 Tax=Pomacea canaliculata TaxID=400727 RepID=UPI000D73294D|nr:exonuclease 1-like isoform X2 [Pomacea canaliculata]
MGIQGLLPFLKKIHKPVNIAQFRGYTVAIDAYCWLHKGAFACADKLALGEKTDQYVFYCMKYVDYLLQNQLKPILVFDGCHLPSKKDVESSRRQRREKNRAQAAQLLREGKRSQAKEYLQRCVDITPQMALELMKACHARGVDCIVAPYEADAQLAYLNRAGIAQLVITEDSDLLLFGCDKIIFKMDLYGNGILIDRSNLNEVCEIQDGFYTFEKFRYMCILSGCDYLPSLPGIGLVKACKVFKIARQTDIQQILRKLPMYLKMNVIVTEEYIEGFQRANNTFLYQLVYDPLECKLCPLNPYPPEIDPEKMTYAGLYFDEKKALQIALGNLDVHTFRKIGDFDPSSLKMQQKYGSKEQHLLSIWSHQYQPAFKNTSNQSSQNNSSSPSDQAERERNLKSTLTKTYSVKQVKPAEECPEVKSNGELISLYATAEPRKKRTKLDSSGSSPVKGEIHVLHSDESIFSRIPHLHSKQNGASQEELTLENTLSPKKVIESGIVQAEVNRKLVGKENKKNASPTKNKFAVSSLIKRNKFHLDGVASMEINAKEVRSRYFHDLSNACHVKQEQFSSDYADGHLRTQGHASDFKSTECMKSRPLNETNEKEQGMLSQGFPPQLVSSLNGEQPVSLIVNLNSKPNAKSSCANRQCTEEGFTLLQSSATHLSVLPESLTTTGETEEEKTQSKESPELNAKRKASPTSVFCWSKFMFGKHDSDSRRPKNNLQSKHPENMDKKSSTVSDNCMFRHDLASPVSHQNILAPNQDTKITGSEAGYFSSIKLRNIQPVIQELEIQNGLSHSQSTDSCSVDSEYYPCSQDFVDNRDVQEKSETNLVPEDCNGGKTIASSDPIIQILVLPQSTPTTSRGNKQCRVSGLSKGKKRVSYELDKKQQKIQDMFARFAHQK